MTDLQASLMAIGGAILVGVISYNKWQEFKTKKAVERAFSPGSDDVLMKSGNRPDDGERHEPTIGPATSEQLAALIPATELPEDAVQDNVNVTVAAEPAELSLDEIVDCIVPLELAQPLRGDKALTQSQSLRHIGNKQVNFVGQREDGSWESLAHGSIYTALYAGIQLANRHNALNELEYSEFITSLRQIADHLDAEPDVPDMPAVMAAARHLYQFVNEHDAQLSVNVASDGAPWAMGTLKAALERQGFEARPDGRMVMPDGEGGVLFTLSTNLTPAADATARLTLLLDVPRVAPAKDGFGTMTSCARMLATRLAGNVVDDSNQPLSTVALAEIAQQVSGFYAEMESADIAAGSVRALRLFS